MLAAVVQGRQVLARDVTRDDGPFLCPECQGIVLVKKGQLRSHHFAHKPPTDCQYGEGESEEHRRAKLAIYDVLSVHPDVTKAQIERPIRNVRPDVSCYIRGKPVAIEVQLSVLGLDGIDRRTRAYHQLGIYVLWTPPYTNKLEYRDQYDCSRYSPAAWEKYVHALYGGQVFYWRHDAMVVPVHYDNFQIYVPIAFNSDGDTVGGYDYPSKRYRVPQWGAPTSLLDFVPDERQPWKGGGLSLPAAHLWTMPRQTTKRKK